MLFSDLQNKIKDYAKTLDFGKASKQLEKEVFSLKKDEFLPIIAQIGIIPENIRHDSTEEKLYAKVSDIVLAKCFNELNMKAIVLQERANSADVYVESLYHNYSLVADAKAFRLSRTAKNQKDFKVESMVHWKGENDYAVLCCPYFQYPKSSSQIYGSALTGNVSLFSWEYFSIMLQTGIKETASINLSSIWNQSAVFAKRTSVSKENECFLEKQNLAIMNELNISQDDFQKAFGVFKADIIKRGADEITYWKNVIKDINSYSKEQAVKELISALKLNEKIKYIEKYIGCLKAMK